ncbi:hypothetical protein B0H21DRAFT_851856 [Amylocystis lapponica]|nr:hypothetical protein B0H21DRAFT_851856 [Amylocystis lapponica]
MPAKGAHGSASGNKTSPSDASRIQSTQTKGGADTGKNSFAARSQASAAKNAAPSTAGAKSGKTGAKA